MTRNTSAGDLYYTGHSSGRGSSSGERERLRGSQERGRKRSSADESQTSTQSSQRGSVGGSSSGGGGRPRFSASVASSGVPDSHHKVECALDMHVIRVYVKLFSCMCECGQYYGLLITAECSNVACIL